MTREPWKVTLKIYPSFVVGVFVSRDTWTPNVPASLPLFAMFAKAFNFVRNEFAPVISDSDQSIFPVVVDDNVAHNGQSVSVDVSKPSVNVCDPANEPRPLVVLSETAWSWFTFDGIASQPEMLLAMVISIGVAGDPNTIVYECPSLIEPFVTLVIVVTVESASIRASIPTSVLSPASHGIQDVVCPLYVNLKPER